MNRTLLVACLAITTSCVGERHWVVYALDQFDSVWAAGGQYRFTCEAGASGEEAARNALFNEGFWTESTVEGGYLFSRETAEECNSSKSSLELMGGPTVPGTSVSPPGADDGNGNDDGGGNGSGYTQEQCAEDPSFQPYGDPQVDLQCQTACLYQGIPEAQVEYQAACQYYEDVANAIGTVAFRPCPAC